MSETPVSLADARAERKWSQSTSPADHDPIDALEAVIRDIRSGEINPAHLIICYGYPVDEHGVSNCGYTQCGSFNKYETVGLIEDIKSMML